MKGQIIGNCRTEIPLTGIGSCNVAEGKTMGILLSALNARYPIDPDTFNANVNKYISATNSLRLFPLRVKGIANPSGGDVATTDDGTYGDTVPTHLNAIREDYIIKGGNDCLYKELLKIKGREMRLMREDDKEIRFGTVVTVDDTDYAAGFTVTVYPYRTKPDGSTAYQLCLAVFYTSSYENEMENMFGYSMPNFPDGLLGVVLQPGTAAGTANVVTQCGNEDVTADHGDNWEPSMFLNESGANPTTVTYDGDTGLLSISPAAKYRVAKAATLEAGDVMGLEGLPVFTQIQ